jgi:hypothetical protein
MRIVRFDQGFRLDDPNIRFGATDDAPAYQLEPGDSGYLNHRPPATGARPTEKRNENHERNTGKPEGAARARQKMRAGAATLQDVIGLHHHRDTTLNAAILKLEGDPAAAPGSNANKGSQLVYKMCEDAAKDARRP